MYTLYSYARWSSEEQGMGDSERRQIAQANQWCAQRGLTLADGFTDRGVSAWKGKNQRGELGKLLNIVKAGDVLLGEGYSSEKKLGQPVH